MSKWVIYLFLHVFGVFNVLVHCTRVLGWDVILEEGDPDDIVEGLVVGTEKFIQRNTCQ